MVWVWSRSLIGRVTPSVLALQHSNWKPLCLSSIFYRAMQHCKRLGRQELRMKLIKENNPVQRFKQHLKSLACSRIISFFIAGGSMMDNCSRYLCRSIKLGIWSRSTSFIKPRSWKKNQNYMSYTLKKNSAKLVSRKVTISNQILDTFKICSLL